MGRGWTAVVVIALAGGCGPRGSGDGGSGGAGTGMPITSGTTSLAEATGVADDTGPEPPEPMARECDGQSFEASRDLWDQLVAESGNTYYMQVRKSDFGQESLRGDPSCSYLYTLQVVVGTPTSRSMVPTAFGQGLSACEPAWEEDEADLGSHDAPLQPWTMEMHYEACEREVIPEDPEVVSLCTFENGALAHCSYYPRGCADGCATGPEGYETGLNLWNFGFGLVPG